MLRKAPKALLVQILIIIRSALTSTTNVSAQTRSALGAY